MCASDYSDTIVIICLFNHFVFIWLSSTRFRQTNNTFPNCYNQKLLGLLFGVCLYSLVYQGTYWSNKTSTTKGRNGGADVYFQ